MSTKGLFSKLPSDAFPFWVSFINNLEVSEVIISIDVSAVDDLGNPATAIVISGTSIEGGNKVRVNVHEGDLDRTYTITVECTTSLSNVYSLDVDMSVVADEVFSDVLDSIQAKTDPLPADPASQSSVESAIATAQGSLSGEHAALQADLDDPDQYKANVSLLALESTSLAIQERTDNLPDSPASSDQLDAIQAEHVAIKADLDNPDQYKANVSALSLETTAQAIKAQTDLLPADPASQSDTETAITNAKDSIEGEIGALQATADDIKSKTDTIEWTDVEFIRAIEGGRWRMHGSQIIFYDEDNTTEIARFSLLASDGVTPAFRPENIFERVRS